MVVVIMQNSNNIDVSKKNKPYIIISKSQRPKFIVK